MSSRLPKGITKSASKRNRSQDSQRSLTPGPVHKASRNAEAYDDTRVPAFLRQSKADIHAKFQEIEWQQQLRIAQGRNDPSSKWVQEITAQARLRNRYFNVQPWEKSRIHLKVGEGKCDYINASPISLRDPKSGLEWVYIAAQGPKQAGLSHFWHMIWQETKEVAVIVMLTQTAESGKEKCSQYFPLDADADAGEYEIEPLDETDPASSGSVRFLESVIDEVSRTTIRKLLLTIGEETRIVWHLLFCGWLDFAIPEGEDQAGLLELLKISAQKNHIPNNPRIIHCSAGVGRSGTFIALEYLLAQLESGAMAEANDEEDMIFDVVNRLREQRMTMVQSDAQYNFLYQVLLEQFERWQATREIAAGNGEPSPKLRKLAKGIRSAFIGDDKGEASSAGSQEGGTTLSMRALFPGRFVLVFGVGVGVGVASVLGMYIFGVGI